MADHSDAVSAYIECRKMKLPVLVELAERVDKVAGVEPPEQGYGLAEAFSAVMNGGTAEDIQAGLMLLQGWSFAPQNGDPR